MFKNKIIWIFLILLLVISYVLLFYSIYFKVTTCILEIKGDNYQRYLEIKIIYRDNIICNMIYKETFSSDIQKILDIKKEELGNRSYHIKRTKKQIKGTKKEKEKKSYKDVLHDLLESGYTCKQ